jgi:hypothetical protein
VDVVDDDPCPIPVDAHAANVTEIG